MENKFTEEDVKLLNTLSDRPPPPFRVGDIVILFIYLFTLFTVDYSF